MNKDFFERRSRGRACVEVWVPMVALVTLGGCATASEPANDKAAHASTSASPARESPAPVDDADKGPLQVIWTRPERAPSVEHGAPGAEHLFATRVSTNAQWLAVDIKSEGFARDSKWSGRAESPTVTLTVDGCPVTAPKISPLALAYNGPEGRVFMPRGELPKGDLAFTFTAFGKEHTMIFANDDKGLRTITEREQKNVMVRPAIPEQGIPETVTVLPSKCDGQ